MHTLEQYLVTGPLISSGDEKHTVFFPPCSTISVCTKIP